jgi:hypothetical protein
MDLLDIDPFEMYPAKEQHIAAIPLRLSPFWIVESPVLRPKARNGIEIARQQLNELLEVDPTGGGPSAGKPHSGGEQLLFVMVCVLVVTGLDARLMDCELSRSNRDHPPPLQFIATDDATREAWESSSFAPRGPYLHLYASTQLQEWPLVLDRHEGVIFVRDRVRKRRGRERLDAHG